MSQSESLKPCPFCGGEPERLELTDEDNFGGSVISCKKCGASSPVHFDRKENLDDSWNRRPSTADRGGDETGWLAELQGEAVPQWAVLTEDYDEHWTTDAAKALRFARKADAEAFIAHHAWTRVVATEHMWPAARIRSALATTAGEASVIAEIAAERRRQVEVEGWTAKHDDEHVDGSLATVAAAYADKNRQMTTFSTEGYDGAYRDHPIPKCWPWSWQPSWWKPTTRRRDLIKAGALIVAEIERLDRAALVTDKG